MVGGWTVGQVFECKGSLMDCLQQLKKGVASLSKSQTDFDPNNISKGFWLEK
jgi:hypothetical protein